MGSPRTIKRRLQRRRAKARPRGPYHSIPLDTMTEIIRQYYLPSVVANLSATTALLRHLDRKDPK